MNVSPKPAAALEEVVPQGPRGSDLGIFVKPSPFQSRGGGALPEYEVFGGNHRPVPGDNVLSLTGDHHPFSVHMQGPSQDALEHRAVHQAAMSTDIAAVAAAQLAQRRSSLMRLSAPYSPTTLV